MAFIVNFLIGYLVVRTARNTATIAERASWSETRKLAHETALVEREAAQRALQASQRPLLIACLGFLAVVFTLAALLGGH
jgi:hypothetical protein